MLINFTNHPSALWSREQREAALAYGERRRRAGLRGRPVGKKENSGAGRLLPSGPAVFAFNPWCG